MSRTGFHFAATLGWTGLAVLGGALCLLELLRPRRPREVVVAIDGSGASRIVGDVIPEAELHARIKASCGRYRFDSANSP
ncbi:MAG TPA: hypothetical protein VKS60_07340 [Stellaceae bacterium]|nr:hypothetical protein [Stellaceae bacterium]